MYTEIIELETALDALLPIKKISESPRKELLDATKRWSTKVWEISQALGPLPLTGEQIEKGKHLVQNPVFICGVHRSGTTLMRDLLDDHPALSVLPSEGSFKTNLERTLQYLAPNQRESFLGTEWLRRLVNPINQPPYWLLDRTTPAFSPYVNFARAFGSWYAIAQKSFSAKTSMWPHLAVILAYATCSNSDGLSAHYCVDKTPSHEKYLQQLWREMPGAKIIHIVRSPANVLLSRKRMEPGLNLRTCLKDMESSYQIAVTQSGRDTNRYLMLRYEELCQNPQSAIARIADFLGIEQLPCLYKATVAGKLAQANSSFSSNLPAGDILRSSVHTDNDSLQPADYQLLSAYVFKWASQLGYVLKPMGKLRRAFIKLNAGLREFYKRKN